MYHSDIELSFSAGRGIFRDLDESQDFPHRRVVRIRTLFALIPDVASYLTSLVLSLGVNYPNWVMRPFDLGNGPFFISVLTTTYFIERKLA